MPVVYDSDEVPSLLEAASAENQTCVEAQPLLRENAHAPAATDGEDWQELYDRHEEEACRLWSQDDPHGLRFLIEQVFSAQGMALAFAACFVLGVFLQILHRDHTSGAGAVAPSLHEKSEGRGSTEPTRNGLGWGQGTGSLAGSSKRHGRERAGVDPQSSFAKESLSGYLRELMRAKAKYQRQKVLAQIKELRLEYVPVIRGLLGDRESELLLPALQAAVYLDLKDAADSIAPLAHGKDVRVAAEAVRAFERLRGWTDDELRKLLGEARKDDLLLLAVVEVFAKRTRNSVVELVPLLGHENARIRASVIEALGKHSAEKDIHSLCEFARSAKTSASIAATSALGLAGVSEEAERCLYELLKRPELDLRIKALEALGKKTSALSRPELIVEMLADPAMSWQVRATALVALENTNTIPVDAIESRIAVMHPVPQLLAARCLVRAGRKSGIPILIQLLRLHDTGEIGFAERSYARVQAWMLLAELSGVDYGTNTKKWLRWYRSLTTLEAHPLKSRPQTSW